MKEGGDCENTRVPATFYFSIFGMRAQPIQMATALVTRARIIQEPFEDNARQRWEALTIKGEH